jgi:predicted DNA-binding transcriptional regulator AlpA
MEQEYLTVPEVAAMTRTPVETLRYWRYMGKGPRSFKVGRRVLYEAKEVREWFAAQRDDRLRAAV